MPLGQFGTPPSADISTKDLADLVARLIKEVTYLLNGGLDTLNVNELSADVINAGTLNAALVTVKAALTGAAYILINAAQGLIINDGTKNTFQADINGLVTMVGALIQSATGYPRVELNSDNNLFAAYQTATKFAKLMSDYNAVPALVFQDTGASTLGALFLSTDFIMTSTINSRIDANNHIDLNPALLGGSYYVRIKNWGKLYNKDTSRTLQQDLDAKANGSGVNGTVYVATTPGGPANTPITFTNGVRTG
jgi:hypothetical protein